MCNHAFLLAMTLLLVGSVRSVQAETPGNERHLSQLVESIVREAVPRTFENRKHWEKRKKVFAGVKVRTEGLNVRISKRKKNVRHGLWRRYSVTLLSPERSLKVRISDVKALGGGKWTYTVAVDVKVNVQARFEHWNLGIKLLNSSADADASLRLTAPCSLQIAVEKEAETESLVIVLTPVVHKVDFALHNLDVKKFGELRGDVATDWFDSLEEVIEELIQTQEGVAAKKVRKEIAKHKDDLRIPLGDFLSSEWAVLWWGL